MSEAEFGRQKKGNIIEYAAGSLVCLIIQISVLGLLDIYLPGLSIVTLQGAAIFVLLLGLANSFFVPILVKYSIRFHPLLFTIFVFLMNGILVLFISKFIPGIEISSIWDAIAVSLSVSITGSIVGGILATDDLKAYERFVVDPLRRRYGLQEKISVPGIVFLEIDGLSEEVAKLAMREGYMPTIKRWMERGSHMMVGWETDLSCQTGGCQPGILHGENRDIPAFRWYEKSCSKLYSSSKPSDVAKVETRVSDGNGLLANGGSSRANMFSGDARESILTISTIGSMKGNTMEYFLFFANPYMIARTAGVFISHFAVEVFEGWLQLARNERPRVHRSGTFPFIRATTTAVLRELSVFALVGDMLRGLPCMYATFVGYDEVAHHAGVARKDALRVLEGLDKMFEWLELISKSANRPYSFVVLSDHGQSNGATFMQRTGKSLEMAVKGLVNLETFSPPSQDETWLRINALLTDVSSQDSRGGRLVMRAMRGKTEDGSVALGPRETQDGRKEAIVLASGNLALIYFTAWKERMSLEQINEAFPGLVPGLLKYPQIGFLMVRSQDHGPLAIGSNGIRYLNDGLVKGEDPLKNFGSHASIHLLREDRFSNCPDILINSFYNPDTREVAAFEELVGSHGGLGGDQSKGILIYPTHLELPSGDITGACRLHQVIRRWVPRE